MKRLCALVVALLVALAPAAALAKESVAALARKLLGDEDFRVRTQAALALGSSNSKKAIDPLCSGLSDDKDTVRAAAAAGLGKLALGGKACLEKRLEVEEASNVKKMIKKAMKLVDAAASGPQLTSDTKYYIAVGATSGDDGKPRVREALRRNLAARDGYALAPDGETSAEAKKRLRKFPEVIAYHFAPKLTVERGDDQIVVTLDVTITFYPEESAAGNTSRTAGRSGLEEDGAGDVEEQLVREACDLAMDDFARMAEDTND